jgi:hypothetical protein
VSYALRQAVRLAAARAQELATRLQAAHAEAVELSAALARAEDADRRELGQDLASMAGAANPATARPEKARPRKPLTVGDVARGVSRSSR